MKNKKGFTLVEIIVAIVLISVIGVGSVVGVNYAKKKSLQDEVDKVYSNFDNALDVYLSNHPEIYENLENNVEGAVITLEVLKNEGLITEEKIIDPLTDEEINYKDRYYILSDAVVSGAGAESEGICDGQVEISVIKNWEALSNKIDTDDVIYVCPKSDEDGGGIKDEEIVELEERVSKLETTLHKMNISDKNYVIFDITSIPGKLAYFPDNKDNNEYEDYNDLWRIVKNDDNSIITLMYNQSILTNYNSLFPKVSDIIEYNDAILREFDDNVSSSKNNCKNEVYLSEDVYSLDAKYLGDYYSFGTSSGIGSIQGLYKIGDDYYESLKKYNSSCYYLTSASKIDDIDAHISAEYSYLKKDSSFKSYFFSNNENYPLDLIGESSKLDFISIFDLREENPFKDDLLEGINSNLKNYIKTSKKSYRYGIASGIPVPINDTSFNGTYFRTLTSLEVNNNKSWLSSYIFPIGLHAEGYLSLDVDTYLNNIITKSSSTPEKLYYIYSTYGELVSNSSYVVDASTTHNIVRGNSATSIRLGTKNPTYELKNGYYYPVIDLGSAELLTEIDKYSNKYKTNRSQCTNAKLGSYECPYLLSLGSYFSDGTTN